MKRKRKEGRGGHPGLRPIWRIARQVGVVVGGRGLNLAAAARQARLAGYTPMKVGWGLLLYK